MNTNSNSAIFNAAMKIAKLLGIPLIILVHSFAVYGIYMYSGIRFWSSILILLTISSMYRRLKKIITMTPRKAEMLIEVEERMKDDDDDNDPHTGFKKNNSIWNNQTDD